MNAFSRDTAPALVEESEEVVLQKVASLIACYERKGEPENAARMRGVMQLRGQALREAREAEIVRLCNSVLGHLIAGGATEEAAYWARVMHLRGAPMRAVHAPFKERLRVLAEKEQRGDL